MRTGLELPPGEMMDLEELEQHVRHVGADLTNALRLLPTVDQTPPCDRELVKDIRFNVAEALRLTVDYRRRLTGRLAGATPARSLPTSQHDPPDACQGATPPT